MTDRQFAAYHADAVAARNALIAPSTDAEAAVRLTWAEVKAANAEATK